MKRLLLILSFLFCSKLLLAEHITGGEMFYTYIGRSGSDYQYRITLKLYRDCNSPGAQLDNNAGIAIFDKGTNAMIVHQTAVPRSRIETLNLNSPGPCIQNAPVVCYQVGYYEFDATLPASIAGYTVAYQRCCRINGITNLANSSNSGATYTADIPGTSSLPSAPENNSARFTGRDTVIVCGGYPFTYSFAAEDLDGDQLSYSFCSAYLGGGQGSGTGGLNTPAPNPPAAPPYNNVPYAFPYNGFAPLGQNVSINPTTGLITGTSPPEGIYVVTVCVTETRNGVVIATQRKDLQIKAGGCDLVKPQLNPSYTYCDDLSVDFTHPNSPLITTYYWDFGDPASGAANNISTLQNPNHVYSAPGQYTIKVVANRGQECTDSSTAIVRVYPGFFPALNSTGICLNNPVSFTDATTANFGVVDKWSWNFGDATTLADTSRLQNSSWTYSTIGTKDVQLIVGSSVGCLDTIIQTVTIIDKPPITLAFKDTLICVPDAVQLQASGTGNFSWTPAVNIVNANTGTPTVNPTATTTYQVQLDEQGCINTDTVRVRVVNFVTLNAMNDTTICLTDPVQLNINSDGLQYQWTPAATLNNATTQDPIATPVAVTTNYQVVARIGSCTATDNIVVTTAPYPQANAGIDTVICFNTSAQLNGSHDGVSFFWSPISSLINSNTLSPVAFPARTTEYILTSFTNNGCPKPGRDTVLVTVLPRIRPFAGNDTLVVVGQPLQFNATGGVNYIWTPTTNLTNPAIANPIGVYGQETDSITYIVQVFNEAGCFDTASIKVTVFKTNPYVFVPTAFTPNGDGLNDLIRPIAVGVERIEYFSIFNRWGQLVFTTTTNGAGWDGRIGGTPQGTNVYVWMVSAIDYTGKKIFLKGTTTLIR